MSIAGGVIYGNGSIPVFGMNLPSAVPMFISGAGSSVVSDVVHEFTNGNRLPTTTSKLGDLSATAIGAGIAGASSVAINSVAFGMPNEMSSLLGLFGLGA